MQPSKLSFEIIKYDCIKRLKLLFNELSFFFRSDHIQRYQKSFQGKFGAEAGQVRNVE